MKTLLLSTLLLLCAATWGGTLTDTLCGTNAVCHNVPNADGAPMDVLQYDWAHGRVLVTMSGTLYDSGLYALQGTPMSWSSLPLWSAEGAQILLSAVFHTWRTCSGRTCLTHWELTGGEVTP